MLYIIKTLLLIGISLLCLGLLDNIKWPLVKNVLKAMVAAFTLLCCWVIGSSLTAFDGREMCADFIAARYDSPRGTSTATVFTRDCGATTSYDDMVPIVLLRDQTSGDNGRSSHCGAH
jgi:hypothetical protein